MPRFVAKFYKDDKDNPYLTVPFAISPRPSNVTVALPRTALLMRAHAIIPAPLSEGPRHPAPLALDGLC